MANENETVVAAVLNDDGVKTVMARGEALLKSLTAEEQKPENKGKLVSDEQSNNILALNYLEGQTKEAVGAALKKQGIAYDPGAETGVSMDVTNALKAKVAEDVKANPELTAKDVQLKAEVLKETSSFIVSKVMTDPTVAQTEERDVSLLKAMKAEPDAKVDYAAEGGLMEKQTRDAVRAALQQYNIQFDVKAEQGISRDVTVAMKDKVQDDASKGGTLTQKDKENLTVIAGDLAVYNESHKGSSGLPPVAQPAKKQQMGGPGA